MVTLMVVETNRYAQQYIAANVNNLKPYSQVRNWKDTDINEMYTFLGIVFLMGIVHKPRMSMYWSSDDVYSTPIFAQLISRDRFLLILRFFHLCNNEAVVATNPPDRLYKIRQLSEMIERRCEEVYYPKRELCVDESLVLFKGRLSFKQFIRTKRARFGVKLYQLCTSSGVMLKYIIYQGNIESQLEPDPSGMFLTTERIPMTLLKSYLGSGHVLYIDNYYTSPQLAKYLLEHQTYMVGTVRANRRNFPSDLCKQNLEKGETSFYHDKQEHVLAMKYRAHENKTGNKPKLVHLLSTCEPAILKNTSKKNKDGDIIQKPASIISYNANMGGVDMVDQQLDQLLVLRKSYKWYKKIAFRLLLQGFLAAHKLYIFNGGNRNHDFLHFMHDAVTQIFLLSPRIEREVRSGRDNIVRLTGRNHFPAKRQQTTDASKQKSKVKRCRVCYARRITTQKGQGIKTTWICTGCPDEPGLCMDGNKTCFQTYHTVFDFSQ